MTLCSLKADGSEHAAWVCCLRSGWFVKLAFPLAVDDVRMGMCVCVQGVRATGDGPRAGNKERYDKGMFLEHSPDYTARRGKGEGERGSRNILKGYKNGLLPRT